MLMNKNHVMEKFFIASKEIQESFWSKSKPDKIYFWIFKGIIDSEYKC